MVVTRTVLLALVMLSLSPALLPRAQCNSTVSKIHILFTNKFGAPQLTQAIKLLIWNDLSRNLTLQATCHYEYNCWANGGGSKCVINQILNSIPPTQYMMLLNLYNNFNNCLKTAKTNISMLAGAVADPLIYRVNPFFNNCLNTFKTKRANRCSNGTIENSVCTSANAGLTKNLTQTAISACKSKVVAKWWGTNAWNCVKQYAPQILSAYGNYNW